MKKKTNVKNKSKNSFGTWRCHQWERERERDRSICTYFVGYMCMRVFVCVLLFISASACIWMLLYYKISSYTFFNTLEQIAIMICVHIFFFFSSYAPTIVHIHSHMPLALTLDIHTCVHSSCTHTACNCAHTHTQLCIALVKCCCCDAAARTNAAERKCAKKNAKNLLADQCKFYDQSSKWFC